MFQCPQNFDEFYVYKRPVAARKPILSGKPRPVSAIRAHILAARSKLNQQSIEVSNNQVSLID